MLQSQCAENPWVEMADNVDVGIEQSPENASVMWLALCNTTLYCISYSTMIEYGETQYGYRMTTGNVVWLNNSVWLPDNDRKRHTVK